MVTGDTQAEPDKSRRLKYNRAMTFQSTIDPLSKQDFKPSK